MEIKSAALIGVGAVGSYFAYGLPAKLGDHFCVIASGRKVFILTMNVVH